MADQMGNLDNTQLEETWRGIADSYRRTYPNLTEEDITYREGEFDNMTDRIAKRTNRSRDQVRTEIRDWEMGRTYREEEE